MSENGIRLPGGLLVVVEGIDGAGKTTLVDELQHRLDSAGFDVVRTREPTSGTWGQRIRDLAADGRRVSPEEEAVWFLEDRKDDVRHTIGPGLAEGAVVLVDRYYFSNMAYQGVRGMEPRRIKADNEAFAPRPDLLFILDIPPEVALGRIREKRGGTPTAFETLENLRLVRDLFLGIAETEASAVKLDGMLTTEEMASEAIRYLDDAIRGRLSRIPKS